MISSVIGKYMLCLFHCTVQVDLRNKALFVWIFSILSEEKKNNLLHGNYSIATKGGKGNCQQFFVAISAGVSSSVSCFPNHSSTKLWQHTYLIKNYLYKRTHITL